MKEVKVKINRLLNFTKKRDLEKAERIRLLITKVVNNYDFRNEILNSDFKDRRFINENGVTSEINDNEIILNKIISGKEQFTGEDIDNEWDLRINLYRSLTGEIGHRSKETIFTKKKKYRNLSERYIAAHWIHEYMHVIGFTHDFKRTKNRPFSVPYLIGTISSNILESNEYDFLT